jgi:hypothetical protein
LSFINLSGVDVFLCADGKPDEYNGTEFHEREKVDRDGRKKEFLDDPVSLFDSFRIHGAISGKTRHPGGQQSGSKVLDQPGARADEGGIGESPGGGVKAFAGGRPESEKHRLVL